MIVIIIIWGERADSNCWLSSQLQIKTNYSLHNFKWFVSWFENTATLFTMISGGGIMCRDQWSCDWHEFACSCQSLLTFVWWSHGAAVTSVNRDDALLSCDFKSSQRVVSLATWYFDDLFSLCSCWTDWCNCSTVGVAVCAGFDYTVCAGMGARVCAGVGG